MYMNELLRVQYNHTVPNNCWFRTSANARNTEQHKPMQRTSPEAQYKNEIGAIKVTATPTGETNISNKIQVGRVLTTPFRTLPF